MVFQSLQVSPGTAFIWIGPAISDETDNRAVRADRMPLETCGSVAAGFRAARTVDEGGKILPHDGKQARESLVFAPGFANHARCLEGLAQEDCASACREGCQKEGCQHLHK